MGFARVRLVQFRNWQDGEVDLGGAERVVLTGQNGQGKTNFLEALYLLSTGASFRSKVDKKLARHGTHELSLRGQGQFSGLPFEVGLKVTAQRKDLLLDGAPVIDRKDLVRRLPCVAFTHEDYRFVSGAPEHQRHFFDQTLSLFDVLYIDTLRQFRKVLRIRNTLLTQRYDPLVMEVYERQLALTGLEITRRRAEAVTVFQPVFDALFPDLSDLNQRCQLRHSPSWRLDDPDRVAVRLAATRDQDARLGFTAAGPHRDRFSFVVDGRNFAEHASTGQIRLLSLLLRIAQARLSWERTGRRPLLLLDDVLLELDPERRRKLLHQLPPCEQAVFTFLPDQGLAPEHGAALALRVDGGRCLPLG